MVTPRSRVVILGAGPTGLGAAYRLFDLGFRGTVHIVDRAPEAGGLSRSIRDDKGFLWDLGGHVIFSHYEYFNRVLDAHVPAWNVKKRESHVWMENRFVPYPLQNNVHHLPQAMQDACLQGLKDRGVPMMPSRAVTFEKWIATTFGEGLGEAFMRPYNRKVWTVDPSQMSSGWVGERVAVPDLNAIREACERAAAQGGPGDGRDTAWGPNSTFRYPAKGGTGAIWKAVAAALPAGWLQTHREVTSIDLAEKRVHLRHTERGTSTSLPYDYLINTLPVDRMLRLAGYDVIADKIKPVYSSTVVIGLGMRGKPPEALANRCWVYFPQTNIPFYRVTVFSNYSDDHVPAPGETWSLMCEMAHRPDVKVDPNEIVEQTVASLADNMGWIKREDVVSKWHTHLEHGYPVPYMGRDEAIEPLLQGLEQSHGILSRGRFGAWKYEVANQDHSFMQGVEAADHILNGEMERTVWNPNEVNGAFQTMFTLKIPTPEVRPHKPLEVVVAHYRESLRWLENHTDLAVVYSKGGQVLPYSLCPRQIELPNIGRESHTFLHHIVHNYHNLADVTLFSQGRLDDSVDHFAGLAPLLDTIAKRHEDVMMFRHPAFFKDWDGIKHVHKWAHEKETGVMRTADRTPGEFWTWMFEGAKPPQYIAVVWAATVAVRREAILRRPKAFYERLLNHFEQINHANPEEGHYLERFWLSIFNAQIGPQAAPASGVEAAPAAAAAPGVVVLAATVPAEAASK